jgi:hypothetical protein
MCTELVNYHLLWLENVAYPDRLLAEFLDVDGCIYGAIEACKELRG